MRYTEYRAGVAVIKDKNLLKEAMAKLAELEDLEEQRRLLVIEYNLNKMGGERMNVLEKILEEIKNNAKLGNMHLESVRIEKVEEIIRSCMNHNGDDTDMEGWIPVSKRLPEPDKMVVVTVHCSEWISDYDSVWVPENEKIHHSEEYLASIGYVNKDGDWIFFDKYRDEVCCYKEFGTDKGRFYSVVTAWRPFGELEPYKGGE